jgi:hypothetical protein
VQPEAEEGFFNDLNERFFTKTFQSEDSIANVILPESNIESYINSGDEWMILISSSVFCRECEPYSDIFDRFARMSIGFSRCWRVDVSHGAHLSARFRFTHMPTIVYFHYDGQRLHGQFDSAPSLLGE